MSTAIKVENLSKIYRLGEIGTGTITQDIDRWFKTKIMGKEDPFLKIGESNDRTRKGNGDIVYSLQDINFEINQGDAVGIIGRNGAGKSTLLKILSRVTTPTTGKINIKGRIASLLEVGTGFHPELTGRENIYLNGAILGMRKCEIDRKLDEIIDFSGVERYIETPVKRYSSGMYVRLAFAVAAHLESEILIVDEVLAVGDVEFQKKCLGKMGEVSRGEGRTVLFVSHNMMAIRSICNQAIVVEKGITKAVGEVNEVINRYLTKQNLTSHRDSFLGSDGIVGDYFNLISACIETLKTDISFRSPVPVRVTFHNKYPKPFFINFILRHASGDVVFEAPSEFFKIPECDAEVKFCIPGNLLNSGTYSIQLNFTSDTISILGYKQDVLEFEIKEEPLFDNFFFQGSGYVRPIIETSMRIL